MKYEAIFGRDGVWRVTENGLTMVEVGVGNVSERQAKQISGALNAKALEKELAEARLNALTEVLDAIEEAFERDDVDLHRTSDGLSEAQQIVLALLTGEEK